ncbi:MAG: murein hydrolase activator EnvC family protein [Rhodospirillaceae bacterium]
MLLSRAIIPLISLHLSILSVASSLLIFPALGQEEYSIPNEADLEAVKKDIERELAAQEDAMRRAAGMVEDEKAIRERIISAARSVQEHEKTLIQIETQLDTLETRRAALSVALKKKDVQMRNALMALQRLAIRPTDALLLQPLRPSDAIRSGLVLSAAVPALTRNTAILRTDLDALYQTEIEIIQHRNDVAANAAALLQAQSRLEEIFAEKAKLRAGFEQRASDAAKRMEELSKEAYNLRDLLNIVIAERKRQAKEVAQPAAQKPPNGNTPSVDIVVARRPASPLLVRSMTQARGTLPLPVMGRLTQRYGEATEGDVRAKGIVFKTLIDAQVVSPFDAVIVFSGPFRGYGKLLILEHSEGYHTLLAGMDRFYGTVGQIVLAGEPVGVMASSGLPSLYLEFRREGQPINPLPWLAANNNEIRG